MRRRSITGTLSEGETNDLEWEDRSMRVKMRALVSTGTPHQCANPGHMHPGIPEHRFLDVLFGALFVAILKSTAVEAYFHGKLLYADREFGIVATQTPVHVRLAGWQPCRPEQACKCTPSDQAIKR